MIEEKKFYTCKYDRAFKEVFMKEENQDILKKVLESILKVEIKKIKYLNQERNVDNIHVRRKHLDLNLETDIGHIEVEVNTSNEFYVRPRNMSYICDIYSHHTLKGEEYSEDTLVIQINFSYGLKDKEYIRKYEIQDKEKNKYVRNFIIYEINMEKYKEIWYSKDEEKIEEEKYILMLDLMPKELKKLSKKDRVVNKYMCELERVNEDPEFHEYMSAEEDNRKIENSLRRQWREEGLAEGREEGLKQGIKEGIGRGIEQGENASKISIAKKMLSENIDIHTISKCTGLSKKEVENLEI